MKKFIFILSLFSSNAFAEVKTACSEDDLRQFAINAHNEIIAKTYYPRVANMKGFQGEGSVIVSFDEEWNIKNLHLEKSTNFEELDIAMLNIIKTSNFSKPNCLPERPINIGAPFRFKFLEIEDSQPANSEVKNNCAPQNILDIKPGNCS